MSLTEVLVALTIFSFVALTAGKLSLQSLKITAQALKLSQSWIVPREN